MQRQHAQHQSTDPDQQYHIQAGKRTLTLRHEAWTSRLVYYMYSVLKLIKDGATIGGSDVDASHHRLPVWVRREYDLLVAGV